MINDGLTTNTTLLGSTDISSIDDGTVTGAIDAINTDLTSKTKLAYVDYTIASASYTAGDVFMIEGTKVNKFGLPSTTVKVVSISAVSNTYRQMPIAFADYEESNYLRIMFYVLQTYTDPISIRIWYIV